MKVVREVNRKEAEVRHKLENEDFDDEEEEWEDEDDAEDDSSDDDVIGDNSKQRSSKNVEKDRGDVSLRIYSCDIDLRHTWSAEYFSFTLIITNCQIC